MGDESGYIMHRYEPGQKRKKTRAKQTGFGSQLMQLTNLCCQVIAYELSRLTVGESRTLIESFPNVQIIELVWQLLCRDLKDSPSLYLLMQNHTVINGGLDSIDWYGQRLSYYRRAMPSVDLVERIRLFNGFQKCSAYHFLTILRLEGDTQGLELLVNMHSLVVLSVAGVSRPEQLVQSWHRALKVSRTRWSSLRALNMPQLRSPRLFFDTWKLVPSLLWMGVYLDPEIVNSIPTLDLMITRAPVKSPMELLHWLQQFQEIDLSDGVILELDMSSRSTIPSVASYRPLESRISKMPVAHGYIRKLGNKGPIEPPRDGPVSKKPRLRGLTRKTSLHQFFGWG